MRTTGSGSVGGEQRTPALRERVGAAAAVAVLLSALGIATGYGMLLVLPLYLQQLGGSEAGFGLVLSAAAIPAVLVLVALLRHPQAVRPQWLLAAAICVFGAGCLLAAAVTSSWQPLVGVGLLLGTAWAVVYTVAPMVMDEMVTDAGRVTWFGYLTGAQQLGIGAGPVLAGWLVHSPAGFRGTFLLAAAVCAAAAGCTVVAGVLTPDARRPATAGPSGAERPGLRESMAVLVRRPTGPWLLVIALFACLFTTMTQFQTTFAGSRGLDYSVFYVAYTIAVIAVRFVVAPWVRRLDPALVIAVAVTVMLGAVASFLLVGSPAAYAAASAALGLGYGLALPATQAHAVGVAAKPERARVLPVAGLVFQTAILAFPLVVGWIVVAADYWLLFAVLVGFALVQAWIAWRQVAASRRRAGRRG